MAKHKPILIGCPQHGKLVRGTYLCDDAGDYRLGSGGQFLVELVKCEHDDGRCMQTLCVLHRYNRRGDGLVPLQAAGCAGKQARPKSARRPSAPRPKQAEGDGTDVLV